MYHSIFNYYTMILKLKNDQKHNNYDTFIFPNLKETAFKNGQRKKCTHLLSS